MHIQDLFEGLEHILQQTESITNKTIDAAQLMQIADYLTQIRVGLARLTEQTTEREKDSELGEKLKDLVARYFRLEGRIKEIRNDHAPVKNIDIRNKVKKQGLG